MKANNQRIKNLQKIYNDFLSKTPIKEILTKKINSNGYYKYSLSNFIMAMAQADRQKIDFTGILSSKTNFYKKGILINKSSIGLDILRPNFRIYKRKVNDRVTINDKEYVVKSVNKDDYIVSDDRERIKILKEKLDITIPDFKIVEIFDISQTTSIEYKEQKKEKEIKIYTNTTDLNFDDVFKFVSNNYKKQVVMDLKDIETKGSFNPSTNNITLHRKDSHTLLHEFSHYLTINIINKDDKNKYAKDEVIAEITAFLISKRLGSKSYNFNYSNIWSSRINDFNFKNFEKVYNEIEKKINNLRW